MAAKFYVAEGLKFDVSLHWLFFLCVCVCVCVHGQEILNGVQTSILSTTVLQPRVRQSGTDLLNIHPHEIRKQHHWVYKCPHLFFIFSDGSSNTKYCRKK